MDPMVQTYTNDQGITYQELNPANARDTWLREVADSFFARNGIAHKPVIFTTSDKDKSSHAVHPNERFGNISKKETPYGYIAIDNVHLDMLYAKRHDGATYAMEWLLGHEYHHTVHNNRTWKNSSMVDFVSGIGGAVAGAIAGAITALNVPKKFGFPPKFAAVVGALNGFLAGIFIGEQRSSRFDEARADLTASKMLLEGRDVNERKTAMEKVAEFGISFISEKNILDNPLLNLVSTHPTGSNRVAQQQLIAQETASMASSERLATIFQTVDQNLINAARNPLQFAMHYG